MRYGWFMQAPATFLMFSGDKHGKAEEAVLFYTATFPNSEIAALERYGPGEIGPEGTVKLVRFRLNGAQLLATDDPATHAFTFTPSISLFVECDSESELESAFAALAEGGSALMPLGNYGFSRRFGWIQDRYGVSWQLNLA